ncbi:MAG: hypothetical protein ABIP39_15435, partial [Polyangiaceae bacterium]
MSAKKKSSAKAKRRPQERSDRRAAEGNRAVADELRDTAEQQRSIAEGRRETSEETRTVQEEL